MKPNVGQIWLFGGSAYYKIIRKSFGMEFIVHNLDPLNGYDKIFQLSINKDGNVQYEKSWEFIKDPNVKCEKCKIK